MSQFTVRYHEHHDDQRGWWSEVPGIYGYVGAAGKTLEEVRRLTAEGITFFLTAGASTEPARSVAFFRLSPMTAVRVSPDAQETFEANTDA